MPLIITVMITVNIDLQDTQLNLLFVHIESKGQTKAHWSMIVNLPLN